MTLAMETSPRCRGSCGQSHDSGCGRGRCLCGREQGGCGVGLGEVEGGDGRGRSGGRRNQSGQGKGGVRRSSGGRGKRGGVMLGIGGI